MLKWLYPSWVETVEGCLPRNSGTYCALFYRFARQAKKDRVRQKLILGMFDHLQGWSVSITLSALGQQSRRSGVYPGRTRVFFLSDWLRCFPPKAEQTSRAALSELHQPVAHKECTAKCFPIYFVFILRYYVTNIMTNWRCV